MNQNLIFKLISLFNHYQRQFICTGPPQLYTRQMPIFVFIVATQPDLWVRPMWRCWLQRLRLWTVAVAETVHSSPSYAHIWGGMGAVVLQRGRGAEGVGIVPRPTQGTLKVQWGRVPSLRPLEVTVAARLESPQWNCEINNDDTISVVGASSSCYISHQYW